MNRFVPVSILLAVLVMLFFAPVLFAPRSMVGNYGDIYLHYYPLKHLITEQLTTGELPLWNPYIFAGQPLLANPQSAVFYPLSIIFYLVPAPLSFSVFFACHFLLAGLFMFLFLSSLRRSSGAALMGSIAFAFSTFLVYRVPAGHPVALSGYVWLPLVALFARDLKDRSSALFLGLALAIQFLSGHTFPVYLSLVLVAFFFVQQRLKPWKLLAIAAGACLLSCALQFIPTFQLSHVTEKGIWLELVRNYSLPPRNLINLILPGFFGNLVRGTYLYQHNPSYFFERHSLYFGVIPLLLAAAGLAVAIKRRSYFYPALTIAGLLLAFGLYTPVYRFFYDIIPGLSFLRAPARFFYLTLFSLTVLAAAAWDRYLSSRPALLKAALVILVIVDLFAWGRPFIYAEDISRYRKPDVLGRSIDPLFRVVTDPDTLPSNKSMFYHHYNLNGYEAILLQDFVQYLGLQERHVFTPTGLARADLFSPLARSLSPGYLVTDRTIPSLDLISEFPGGTRLYRYPDALPRVVLAKNAVLIPDSDVYDQIAYLRRTPYASDAEVLVGKKPIDAPFFSAGGKIISFRSGPSRVETELSLSGPGILVFGDIAYPGWRVFAAGREHPVFRANKVLRAVFLEKGEYTGHDRVFMVFSPGSLRFGLSITLIALFGAAASATFLLKRRYPSP